MKTLKGKVLKKDIELWDREVDPGRKYRADLGVVDFIITKNVVSWVKQGLVEVYDNEAVEGEAPKAKPVDKVNDIADENVEVLEEAEIEKEIESVKAKRRKKKK